MTTYLLGFSARSYGIEGPHDLAPMDGLIVKVLILFTIPRCSGGCHHSIDPILVLTLLSPSLFLVHSRFLCVQAQ